MKSLHGTKKHSDLNLLMQSAAKNNVLFELP